jgi:hypothetical protein
LRIDSGIVFTEHEIRPDAIREAGTMKIHTLRSQRLLIGAIALIAAVMMFAQFTPAAVPARTVTTTTNLSDLLNVTSTMTTTTTAVSTSGSSPTGTITLSSNLAPPRTTFGPVRTVFGPL